LNRDFIILIIDPDTLGIDNIEAILINKVGIPHKNLYTLEDEEINKYFQNLQEEIVTIFVFRSDRQFFYKSFQGFPLEKIKEKFRKNFTKWKSFLEKAPSLRLKIYDKTKKYTIKTFNDSEETTAEKIKFLRPFLEGFCPSSYTQI